MSHNRDECGLCATTLDVPIIPNGASLTANTSATQTADGEWHFKIDPDSIRVLSKEEE